MSSSSDRLRPGHLLDGKYELLDPLGRGGAGMVYRARDATGRQVALKTLIAAGGLSARQAERFRREGEIAAQLDHPGIVRVYGSGLTSAGPYLVYELVEGARDLSAAAADLDLPARALLVRDAALALGYAHDHGVVHRDVKPDNLLVDDEGKLRITDFGAALGEGQERLTLTGGMVGTPYYMAPEQLSTERTELGPPVDVWGLGVVLYELLTDQQPFPAEHMGELYARIQEAQPKPPRRLNAEVPRSLDAVCLRALSGDPARRYADGRALAAAIEGALNAPRRLSGRAVAGAVGAAALLVLGAAFALSDAATQTPPPAPPAGPAQDSAPTTTPPEPSGDEALERVQALEDPLGQFLAARDWLARFPDHPRAAAIRRRNLQQSRAGPLRTFHGVEMTRVRFLDGDVLAYADEKAVVLRPLIGEEIRLRYSRSSGDGRRLAVSADRKHLAFSHDQLTVWVSSAPWRTGRKLTLSQPVSRLALSPDGSRLVIGNATGVHLYTTGASKPLRMLQEDTCNQLMIDPAGRIYCTWERFGAKRYGVRVFSAEGELLHEIPLDGKHDALALAPDGTFLLAGSPEGLMRRFARTDEGWEDGGLLVHSDEGEPGDRFVANLAHRRRVAGVRFLDPRHAISVSGGIPRGKFVPAATGNEARLWRVDSREHISTALRRTSRLTDLDLSSDGVLFAVAAPEDGTCEVWSIEVFAPKD